MKEFTRIAWASDNARNVWEPRVTAIQKAWSEVELESVVQEIRACALVFGAPDQGWCDRGLVWGEVTPGRFAVGRTALAVNELRRVYGNDDVSTGRLLGFPQCCRVFFHRVWNIEKKRDTALSMDFFCTATLSHRELCKIDGDVHCNILGRWLGVRFVPHLPCSWNCLSTMVFAQQLEPLWPKQEREWAAEILSWPVEYSALHGIAIVTFPVVKVITNTDYTARKVVLRREGISYPNEAPAGLDFPFRKPNFTPLTSLKSFKRSLEVA